MLMKKWLVLLLSLVMVISLPVLAFATEKGTPELSELNENLVNLEAEISDLNNDMDKQLLQVEKGINQIDGEIEIEKRSAREKVQKLVEFAIQKVELEAKFIQNTREVKALVKDIHELRGDILSEVKDIIKEDRNLTREQVDGLKDMLAQQKRDRYSSIVIARDLAKETANFTKNTFTGQFINVYHSFQEIIALQEQQIEVLKAIEQNLEGLLYCLRG